MNKRLTLAILNIVTLIATITVNALANLLPINGQTTGGISDKFDVLFTPAGYVFSIWGVIYLGLIAFVIYQILPAQRNSDLIDKVGIYFILSNLANVGWIFAWHYEIFFLSLVLMLTILYSLLKIYLNLDIDLVKVSSGARLSVFLPFSLYTGWISIATIANVTIFLESIGWNGFGLPDVFWFVIVMVTGIVVLSQVLAQRHDLVYGAVFIWAFTGIAVKNGGIPTASTISWIAVVLVILLVVWEIVRRVRSAS